MGKKGEGAINSYVSDTEVKVIGNLRFITRGWLLI